MPRLKWSERALIDVARLHPFLVLKNRTAAKRAVRAIRQSVKILARRPEVGRPMEDMPSEFRELVIPFGQSAYVAVYYYDKSQLVILAVRHGREAGY